MKKVSFIISAVITIALILVLNRSFRLGGQTIPAIGKFLNPLTGFWQNAEPYNSDFNADLKFPGLKGRSEVFLDERLIPHIFAENDNDVYFIQGYLHAKYRLWQMELQAFGAAGRISEILGEPALEHDREFRRLGMVYAAENSLKEIESDSVTKLECDAYTAGVNSYIGSLDESSLPVEYKLLSYKPEKWSNLKTSLVMKYMSYDLAGASEDFEMTNARQYFSKEDFEKLFPQSLDSLDPVIPRGTIFEKEKVFPKKPMDADSVFSNEKSINIKEDSPAEGNGSNNWAVSGRKTKSGYPILANDPHLTLSLPSVWYELQLSSPGQNIYGVSFPGVPSIMIGFNESCAFGFTNGARDVRDYYEIKFKDASRKEYLYNGSWQKTIWKVEQYKIRSRGEFTDSVAYVLLGDAMCPVMYDKNFSGTKKSSDKFYAVRWKGNDPSNELKAFNMLNRVKSYDDFTKAIENLHTPGQNAVFASIDGDIAIRTQGEWPAKWEGQGDFIMPGTDSNFLWQGMIPQDEVPFQLNPERGFVSSANQKAVDDKNYPYYIGRNYTIYRGKIINRKLNEMSNITPQDMMAMQNDNYNIFAEMTRPIFLKAINENELNPDEKKYFELLKNWNLKNDSGSKGATVFEVVWSNFYRTVFDDDFSKAPEMISHPSEGTLAEAIIKDSNYKFLDNINTDKKENLNDDIHQAFKKSAGDLKKLDEIGKLDWEKFKGTQIKHLSKLIPFSSMNIPIGGSKYSINSVKSNHGPSWRMVVSLGNPVEAFGVYPGGQSGNPGSKYYDDFIKYWVDGKYYTLWLMKKGEQDDKRIKWKMNFSGV